MADSLLPDYQQMSYADPREEINRKLEAIAQMVQQQKLEQQNKPTKNIQETVVKKVQGASPDAPTKFQRFMENFRWFTNPGGVDAQGNYQAPQLGFLNALATGAQQIGAGMEGKSELVSKLNDQYNVGQFGGPQNYYDFVNKQQDAQARQLDVQIKKKQLEQMDKVDSESDYDYEGFPAGFKPSKGFSKEDYIPTPVNRVVRGQLVTKVVPQLKPALPSAYDKDYRGLSRVMKGLELNVKQLAENPKFEKEMSPMNIKAMRPGSFLGNIGQIMIQIDPNSKEFGTFKSETDKLFQQFRKETTGAQAALAELGWLAPDFPETTDNPELYKEKASVAIQRMQEAQQLLRENWGANYRMPKVYGTENSEKIVNKNSGKTSSGLSYTIEE